jgi:uncharacterized membrane protein HdeD (DUF308 family)
MTDVAAGGRSGAPDMWWVPVVMGIVAVLFGILLLVNPGATSVWVAWLVGFWWLVSGIMNLVSLFVDRTLWGLKLFSGILGLLAGALVLQAASNTPLLAAIGLGGIYVLILGIEGTIIGVVDIVKAFQGAGWGIGILGVLSVVFGIFLIKNPFAAALALPLLFGILAVVLGGTAIFVGFRARNA